MVSFDPGADFDSIVDGLRPVTLIVRSTGLTMRVDHSLPRAVSFKESLESNGKYTQSDLVYHIPSAALLQPPVPGDAIRDERGDVWVILAVSTDTFRSRYRAITRNLAIAHSLDTLVTIQEATFSKGISGAQQASWSTTLSNVRARIQPVAAGETTDDGLQRIDTQYRIYLQEPLQLRRHNRIIAADGTIYRVLGIQQAERIDQLMYVEAEQDGGISPWPPGAGGVP